MAEGGGVNLEYTPTWVVALVCSIIVAISLAVERLLHFLGKLLKRKKQKPLFEALQKIKEELMLLGFISLLLTVSQTWINKICIPEHLADKWLPCKKSHRNPPLLTFRLRSFLFFLVALVAAFLPTPVIPTLVTREGSDIVNNSVASSSRIYFRARLCSCNFLALTILFGSAKIRQWKSWEESVALDIEEAAAQNAKLTHVHDHDFIKKRFRGFSKNSYLLAWIMSFFKQFYGSVTKSDYITLRLGFIMSHCKGNRNFDFHKYMMRALEADFKKVVGISWYLWLFVIVFLLLNVAGWHAYFWIAFIPFILLLAVGTKLEHVITQLANEVAEKHVAVQGDLVVKPSDDHFWFSKPKIILILIHIILFQNSFELAFFFFIWLQYGFNSCIMDEVAYIIPRTVIGVFVQFVCSYSTLPLYAIVTQMGSSFKKAIFEENVQEGLVGWAKKAKKNTILRKAANGTNGSGSASGTGSSQVAHKGDSPPSNIQLTNTNNIGLSEEESSIQEITLLDHHHVNQTTQSPT